MSQINFKRIIEEAYENGITQLHWNVSGSGTFQTVRYPNAIVFLSGGSFLGSAFTDSINYSTRRFTPYISQKLCLTQGEWNVEVGYVKDGSIVENFSFYGEVPAYNTYCQLMFKPIKEAYLRIMKNLQIMEKRIKHEDSI